MTDFKPMLAATLEKVESLQYPMLASPKLDGVRAVVIDGTVLSRNLKPIPNRHVQKLFGKAKFNGLDGELIVGEAGHKDVFRSTMSGVTKYEGEPDVLFHVFDDFSCSHQFHARLGAAAQRVKASKGFLVVDHVMVKSHETVTELEERYLADGFEGLMLRHPHGPYKYGRSTLRESFLLKLKRFMDDEAVVIDVEELMHNENDHLDGLSKRRSTKKEGLKAGGVLGALVVHNPKTDQTFKVGSGFTAEERRLLWAQRDTLAGRLVRYKYFPSGTDKRPRFPTFSGFRHAIDA